jgi:NADH-quinone oxidoreductase subunit K
VIEMNTPQPYLLLSTLLFAIGISVVIIRQEPWVILMGVELTLQSVALALAALTSRFQDWGGQLATLTVLTIGAIVLVVGTGVILAHQRGQPQHSPPTS